MIPKDVDEHDLSEKIENDKENSEKVPTFFSQRWILAYLFFTGLFNVYAVRVNISVALVCMVKTPIDNSTLTISPVNNISKNDTGGGLYVGKQTYQQRGEFDWDKSTRSAILSSFFYGYMVTQIPGGWLADRFGGRRVFGLSMAIASVLTLLTPTCARISVKLVYLLRVILGLTTNGALSSLPYICQSVMAIVAGNFADYLRKQRILTTGQTRKLFQSIAFIGAGAFLVVTGFVPIEMNYLAVLFLCLAVTSLGFGRGGFSVNHIDVAPKFGGIMLGITNTMATIQGIVAPQIAGALTPNDTQQEWRNVFYVCAGFCLFGTIIYGSFARGEVQTWAKDTTDDESRKYHLTAP